MVVKAKIIHARVSNSEEFFRRINEKIIQLNADHSENFNDLMVQDKQETLEMFKIKPRPIGRRKGNESIVIYLWCKSQRSLFKLRELLETDKLFRRFDVLISCLNSKKKESLYELLNSVHYKVESPQFLKRVTIDAMEFQKEVGKRNCKYLHHLRANIFKFQVKFKFSSNITNP